MAPFGRIVRPALLPLSLLYGMVVLIRNWLFDAGLLRSTRFSLPVISVGNITVGGTGKTPHVEYLIRQLRKNYRLAVLSRGYKRKTTGFILASGNSGVADIGDEPLQIKQKFPDIPVAVENDRVLGVHQLMQLIPDLQAVILDDAYQHRTITPGLSILLIDFTRPVFRDILLPAGNLREPVRNIRRADIILVTKCPELLSVPERETFITKLNLRNNQLVLFTCYAYGTPLPVFPQHDNKLPQPFMDGSFHHKKPVLLVTGIANPAPLRQYLASIFDIRKELDFPDHHNYNLGDYMEIQKAFESIEAAEKYILVTEKDAVRIRESEGMDDSMRKAAYYIPIEVKFLADGEGTFLSKVYGLLRNSGTLSD